MEIIDVSTSALSKLAETAKKDKKYLGQIYELTFDSIYRYVMWRVGKREDVEDIVSSVYLDLVNKISGFDSSKSSFKSWLYIIARNKTYDFLRKKYREVMSPLDEDINGVDYLAQEIEISLFMEKISKLMKKEFTERQQELFALKYSDGFSNKEISQLLDLDEKTISSSLSKIVRKLETMLK